MATDPGQLRARNGLGGLPQDGPSEAVPDLRRSPVRRADRTAFNAQTLGWLSVGLGVAALLAPRTVGRMTGLGEMDTLLRFVGARELSSGLGLLTQERKAPWLWSRVLGDVMDLAVIATAFKSTNPGRNRAFATAAVVAAITAADMSASLRSRQSRPLLTTRQDAYLAASVITSRSREECYSFWRDLSNLPKFTRSLESVNAINDRRSHWVLRGPLRSSWEWDSEITTDRSGECIAWKSVEGAQIRQAGMVSFDSAPGGRGTLVRLSLHYQPPAGGIGVSVAKLFGSDPRSEAREDLRRFRQLIETGEIPTTRGQPSGRRSLFGRATPEGRLSREGKPI